MMNEININQTIFSRMYATYPMERNKIIQNSNNDSLINRKQRIAFHEAGHATAICLNNQARNLPPVFFQIMLKDLNGKSEQGQLVYQAAHDECFAKVEGGRLIELLPHSIDDLVQKTTGHNDAMVLLIKDYITAFETDIINLLIGPLSEAKHVADTDDEPFNHRLVNLNALNNYDGTSDLELVNDYLQSFSACKQQRDEELDALFAIAFNFINDQANWAAITKLANYILDSNKNIISCDEVISLLEH